MRVTPLFTMLIMAVTAITLGINTAEAADVGIQINGYLPAPPGVYVQVDAGRPYYMERNRRVYMERERPRHHKNKHQDKEEKHHDDKDSHDKHEGHGR